ncbi:MFS transporter [Candidatus Schneideria nysicola]|uniref:MFS transporter n=1 Tax=Candidatus Schneideria nysicola TaxID=1081631 RepID=UPI001CAA76BB|nr:MFS transporter [Candidatus Schneideria nysicola]UAJ65044.1 MFS transporter [Candidatus Schneideria nysicola]
MYNFSLFKNGNILFPFSLVLFEFTVYIANDMIQPSMLEVVKNFNVGIEWIPTSLTAYLAGGGCLEWFFGPLSDQRGRRSVMLIGVLFFTITCLAILLVSTIEQFIMMRFLQGIGLCFIGSVGYATIQEAFEEVMCIRIIAMMANVALIAPLLGPLAGALLIHILSWQTMFLIFAFLSLISFIGLWLFMPETVKIKEKELSFTPLWKDYKKLFLDPNFMSGALATGFSNIPLLAWIALSPIILINEEKFSIFFYAILQLPIFGGLILGNIILHQFIENINILKMVNIGYKPMILGLIIAGSSAFSLIMDKVWILILGLSIYSFGLGITNACLTRLTLFTIEVSKGTVSAAMGMIGMIVFILGIEISKIAYLCGKLWALGIFNLFGGCCCLISILIFLSLQERKKSLSIK